MTSNQYCYSYMKTNIYNTKRKHWNFKPTTRVKINGKIYSRKRLRPLEVDECFVDA